MSIQLKRRWQPHPGQQQVLESDARFRLVACGRRWGKTSMAVRELFERALQSDGGLFWWVAPSYPDVDNGFRMLKAVMPTGLVSDTDIKESPPHEVTLPNGAVIQFRSTGGSDLVGVGLEFLVIDEAAKVPENSWREDLRPTLSDTLGDMLAISTPEGRNWFHDWWQRGQSSDWPDIDSWRGSTFDNPHVPDEEIEGQQDELPERIYRQEYLAEFIDDAGGVFERVRERIVEAYDYETARSRGRCTIGVDFARADDYTVIIALDSDGRLVAFDRLRNVGWPTIQSRVEGVHASYGGEVFVDATRDNKIVSDLERGGIPVEPVTFTAKTKRELIENLTAVIEQEAITIPDIPDLISELQLFKYDVTRAGNIRYGAPDGHHDDAVDALALAVRGLTNPNTVDPDEFFATEV